MVETLAEAQSDSEGGDDGVFFRPQALNFQVPASFRGTALEDLIDKLRVPDSIDAYVCAYVRMRT